MMMEKRDTAGHPEMEDLVLYYYDALSEERSRAVREHVLLCGVCGEELESLNEAEQYSQREVFRDPLFAKAEQFIKSRVAGDAAAMAIVGLFLTTRLFKLARASACFAEEGGEFEELLDLGDGSSARLWCSASGGLMLTLSLRSELVEKRGGVQRPILCSLRDGDSQEELPLCFIVPVKQQDIYTGTSDCGPLDSLEPLDRDRALILKLDAETFSGEYREAFFRSLAYVGRSGGSVVDAWRQGLMRARQEARTDEERKLLQEALDIIEKG
jgi:hypothetical protein